MSLPAASPRILQVSWAPPETLLDAASNDDRFLVELIDDFKMETESRIRQLRHALATSDVLKIRAEAHAIKGSAMQVGADAVAEACRELELASALPGVAHLAGLVDRLERLFEEMRRMMASYTSDGCGR